MKRPTAPGVCLHLSLVIASCTMLAACATIEKAKPAVVEAPTAAPPASAPIDLDRLQEALGMTGSREDVGYGEKKFGTCEMGYGFSSNRDCRSQYLVVLRFQLQCRESEGTSSDFVDQKTIHAIRSDHVRWTLGAFQGVTRTDADGFGQIRFLANQSSRRERVRLTVDGRFMILRAEDLNRVVTPANWCVGR